MYFQIDDLYPPVEGIDLGGTWNGWRRPRFTKDSADLILLAHNEEYGTFSGVNGDQTAPEERLCAWYEPETRTYWFYLPDSDETERFDPIVVEGVDHWDIGTDGWCWEAAPVTRLTLTFVVVGADPEDLRSFADNLLDEGVIQDSLTEDCGADGRPLGVVQSDCSTEVLP